MSTFMSKRFEDLEAYVPGEQPKDMEYIKLNTNESPYSPSSEVEKAIIDEVKKLNLYPDPEGIRLKEKIAKLYGVNPKNVFLSNGSDEILSFSFMAFCDGETSVAFPDISYGFYEVYAKLYGLEFVKIKLNEDFSITPSDYFNLNKTIVIANPNAPTGLSLSLSEIESIVLNNRDNVVIIDEAYVDFGGESALPLINKYNNLLVVRTFSKSRSMAGARLGFAFGNEALIEDLEKIKYSTNPYNINRLTLVGGEAAIDSNEYYMENCDKIIKTREYTKNELLKLGFTMTDSKSNFIFARSDKISGELLYKKLKEKGVLVRFFNKERIKDFVRITVGTPDEMKTLIEKIKEILE